MPKSAKKKKEKATDFTKAKLKLGKGKLAANNAIDTSFKARSIAVPYQTIGQEKDESKPTTRRNLTLEEVLQHLKHYNPNTRKEAISGLRELLEGYPHLIEHSITSIIQTCARLMADEDAEVRKSLISFLAWFLPSAPLNKIRPHIPNLMLFVTSAQTNIFPAIRVDAVRILNILLELTPDLVVQNWFTPDSTGSRVLEGFLGLLSVGSTYWKLGKDDEQMPTTASVTLSSTSQYAVLSTLAKFIAIAVSGSDGDDSLVPLWYMANVFPSEKEFRAFSSLILPTLSTKMGQPFCELNWSSNPPVQSDERFIGDFSSAFPPSATTIDYSIKELGEVGQVIAALRSDQENVNLQPNAPIVHIAHLARTLHPVLVSLWLDVAPTLFGVTASSSKFEIEAKLAEVVVQIASCLYGAIFRERDLLENLRTQAFGDINTLLSYMSPYLPTSSSGNELDDCVRSLSFSYCELTSLTALASQSQESSDLALKQRSSVRQNQVNALMLQLKRVGEYVHDALDGELTSTAHPMGYSLTSSVYSSLLPTIWSLINAHKEADASIRLACVKHAVRTSSRSSAKAAATQFVGMLLLIYGSKGGPLKHRLSLSQEEIEAFREWYQQLPKALWGLGTGDPTLTEIILRLLLRITQRRMSIFDMNTLSAVRSRLMPFFSTKHPVKGTILGPFVKLQKYLKLQRLALDVALLFLREGLNSSEQAFQAAVDNAVENTPAASYWHSHFQYRD